MRLAPRSSGLSEVATALSLVLANYKPVPHLPTASQVAAHGFIASSNLSAAIVASNTAHQSFQVQPASTSPHDIGAWGQPSVLYIPSTMESKAGSKVPTAHGTSFANASPNAVVGPGECPVQESYTPSGGWQALPDPVFAPFDSALASIYRYRQQVGVNLGAWMVQEAWMTPSLFACAVNGKSAELDILAGFGSTREGIASATAYMMQHWDTWITEADFVRMQQMGINTVRIPIGHWSVGPHFARNSSFSDYAAVYETSWRFIARAINWAAKYDMGVLLDMHGAYGSQNGQAHSGMSDGSVNFFQAANRELTRTLLVWLANELSDVTNVIGIELLNEPVNRPSLWKWYTNTMDAMRSASPLAKDLPLYFHDAFSLEEGAAFVANRTDFVVQDNHSYFVFGSSDSSTSAARHTSQIRGSFSAQMAAQSNIARGNLVVGEWSCALAPSSLAGSSNSEKDTQDFCTAQQTTYAATASGQMFWAWKMENCHANAGWCLKGSTSNGRYLPSIFDAWNFGTVTVESLLASVSSGTFAALLQSIDALEVPVVASLTNGVVASLVASASSAAFPTAAITIGNGVTSLTSILRKNSSVLSKSAYPDEEHGRVGMVEKLPQQHIFSVGSPAARAHSVVRRERHLALSKPSSAQAHLFKHIGANITAAQAGYSDGFKTVQIFAAQGRLSRLGFAQQYMADSWAIRLAQAQPNKLHASDEDTYRMLFAKGSKAAEKAVRSLVTAAA